VNGCSSLSGTETVEPRRGGRKDCSDALQPSPLSLQGVLREARNRPGASGSQLNRRDSRAGHACRRNQRATSPSSCDDWHECRTTEFTVRRHGRRPRTSQGPALSIAGCGHSPLADLTSKSANRRKRRAGIQVATVEAADFTKAFPVGHFEMMIAGHDPNGPQFLDRTVYVDCG